MFARYFFCRRSIALLVLAGILVGGVVLSIRKSSLAAEETPKPLEKVPAGQTYVGTKVCGSCHFDQLVDWKKTKHAKGFEMLPAKYQSDKACLKCHTTGFGEESGFTTLEKTPDLVGASCESCHGPGSKHSEIAKKYSEKKPTKEEELYIRSTIHKMQPRNVCVDCHLTRAHKKHPDYDK